MKMSVRRIVLLILSIIILGLGVYSVISAVVQATAMRDEILIMLSNPQFSEVFPEPEKIVGMILGIAIAVSCISSAFVFVPGILGLLASFKKYKGGVHVVFAWIHLVFSCLGLIVSIVGFIKASQFNWIFLVSLFEVAVVIAFIIIAKQIKEEED